MNSHQRRVQTRKHRKIIVDLEAELLHNNNTGFATQDLLAIAEQHYFGEWSEPMTADELMAEIDALLDTNSK